MNATQHSRWDSPGDSRNNQQSWQRWAPLVGGSTLAVLGLTRRSKAGWALAAAGGALAFAGTRTGRNKGNAELASNILVNASPEDAYRRWRDLESSPQWMSHIESVHVLDDRRSHWTASGLKGAKLQWTAEIIGEREGEYIEWRSTQGSDLNVHGRVEFKRAPNDRGTIVSSHLHYAAANGALRFAASGFLGRQAKFFMRQDMRRFKALIETGEIPTTKGQTHGPRSAMDMAAKALNPDKKSGPQAQRTGVLEPMRRVS